MSLRELRDNVLAARRLIEADLGLDAARIAAIPAVPRGAGKKKRKIEAVGVSAAQPRRTSSRRSGFGHGSGGPPPLALENDDEEEWEEEEEGTAVRPERQRIRRATSTVPPRPAAAAAVLARAARAKAATDAGVVEEVLVVLPPRGVADEVVEEAVEPIDTAVLIKCLVTADTQLRAFVEGPLNQQFIVARSYHEFKAGTSVYTTSGFIVEDTRTGAVFAGRKAHAAVGGATLVDRRSKVPPPLPPYFRLYLLSRSHTRKLKKGQRFIYALIDAEKE